MVAHGICEELDELKHTYTGLPDFLTKERSHSALPNKADELRWLAAVNDTNINSCPAT